MFESYTTAYTDHREVPAVSKKSKKQASFRKPNYRRQRRQGRPDIAFVEINGRRQYLGEYDSPESLERYERLCAELLANVAGNTDVNTITIVELVDAFWRHAQSYYVTPEREPSSEQRNFRYAIRPLLNLYGRTQVRAFGPKSLKVLRTKVVAEGASRTYANRIVRRIRQIFRWGVEEEIVMGETLHRLQAIKPLMRGRTEARETDPVKPVSDTHVEAIRPFVSRTIWAMIQVQRLTGARGGEICLMRPMDIDTTGRVWIFTPHRHKNAWRGHGRQIFLGPRAQAIIAPFLADCMNTSAYLFSPQKAERERRSRCATHRRPDQVNAPRKTDRVIGDHYVPDAYRRAIEYACDHAFPIPPEFARRRVPGGKVPGKTRWETITEWHERLGDEAWTNLKAWRRSHRWHPHQLRHSMATQVRREFGLEAAQVFIGHADANVTQIYAESDKERGVEVALKIG